MIDIDPRIELAHGGVVEQFGQRLEFFGEFRVGVEVGLTHHWRGGVVREVVLVVFQQFQLEGVQATVGGVDQTGKHLTIAQGGVDQPGIHLADVFAGQVHAVEVDHAVQTVGTVGELGVQRHQVIGLRLSLQHRVQLADGVDLRIGLRGVFRQGQGVGVAELRRGEPDQAFFRVEFFHPGVGLSAVEFVGDMVVSHQRHAGVFPHQIQLTTFVGAAGQVAAQTAGHLGVVTLGAQVLGGDFRQQGLFGEHPGADADHRFFSGLGKSCEQQDAA